MYPENENIGSKVVKSEFYTSYIMPLEHPSNDSTQSRTAIVRDSPDSITYVTGGIVELIM
jgi:hypothetical protein